MLNYVTKNFLPLYGAFLITIIVVMVLVACASDGSLAGKGKPVDKEQTRVAVCDAAQKVDIAFQGIAKAAPGVIPPKVMDGEGAALDLLGYAPGRVGEARVGSLCAKVYNGDVNVAINTAIQVAIDVTPLLAKWKQ